MCKLCFKDTKQRYHLHYEKFTSFEQFTKKEGKTRFANDPGKVELSVKTISNFPEEVFHCFLSIIFLVFFHDQTFINFSPAAAGVNFTNILRAAFTHADLKSARKLLNLTVFFALLGSGHIKAAHIMLVKLTPGYVSHKRNTGESREGQSTMK